MDNFYSNPAGDMFVVVDGFDRRVLQVITVNAGLTKPDTTPIAKTNLKDSE